MSRRLLATFAGLIFMVAYVTAAILLPDWLGHLHWAVEAGYWAVAGIIWVFPIWWLMLWTAAKR